MNAASRLRILFEARKDATPYLKAVKKITGVKEKYKQLIFIRYFTSDVKKIENFAKKKQRTNDTLYKKLSNILYYLSPAYSPNETQIKQIIEDLDMLEFLAEDEENYHPDIAKLKSKLNSISLNDEFVSEIVQEMKETLEFYSFFGEEALKDGFLSIGTMLLSSPKKTKLLSKEILAAILLFLDITAHILSQSDEAIQNLINIKNNIQKLLPNIKDTK